MQATLAQRPATDAADGAATPSVAPAAAADRHNAFVINLVSSTTPVALTRPDHAGLKRFNFFVSRRREDGRERFRLHMGYFDTQQEAEQLLDIVRTIYPGAWAGLAPGRRLGGGASGVPGTAPPAAAPASAAVATALAATPSAVPASAPTPAAATPSGIGAKAPASTSSRRAPSALPRSVEVPTLTLMPDEGRKQLSDVTLDLEESSEMERPAAGGQSGRRERRAGAERFAGSGRPADLERPAARRSMSNVRHAIAALADDALLGPMPRVIPELKAAIIPTARPVVRQGSPAAQTLPAAPAAVSDTQVADDSALLSDTAALRLLEKGTPEKRPDVVRERSAPPASPTSSPATAAGPGERARRAPSSSPQGPRATLREDKAWYAVQLVWSVQPITMTQIPQLAIFGAYTLYGAEGNRDGRRWYGLRLGFFTDAVSAKQVAHYVRGDFATVSVVPVTVREREQALRAVARATAGASAPSGSAATGGNASTGASARAHAAAGVARAVTAASAVRGVTAGAAPQPKQPRFVFIEGTEPLKEGQGSDTAAAAGRFSGASRPGGRPTRGAPGKRAKPRPPGQIHARTRTKPKTLEETLEILGAGELRVDDDPSALLNDAGMRQMQLEPSKAKPSKLSRLIERLSERMGG